MPSRGFFPILICLLVVSLAATNGRAEEPFGAFLKSLQASGYGEQALDYIDQIAARPDLPAEMRESLDLERSRAMRLAASEAYDQKQRDERLAQSQALLDKFLKEHPNHPAMGEALLTWAGQLLEDATRAQAMAKGVRDKDEQETLLTTARTKLLDAGSRYDSAKTLLKERLDKMPENASAPKSEREAREATLYAWLDARFRLGQVMYFTAQGFSDPAAPERKTLLESASQTFDEIFQEFRNSPDPAIVRDAMWPHLWQGRALEDLGDKETAIAIYEEAWGVSPEGKDITADGAEQFGLAYYLLYRALATQEPPDKRPSPEDRVAAGEAWLKDYRKWSGSSIYQGMALEVCKAELELSEKLKSADAKRKATRAVILKLAAIGKVDSDFQSEALLLRRELLEKLGATEGGLGGDESLALADAAAKEDKLPEAIELYKKAIATGQKNKDEKLVAGAVERLNFIRYRIAFNQFSEGKYSEALDTANEIVKDSNKDPVAPQTSALAAQAALRIYSAAAPADRPAALERLEKIANYTIKTWPDAPEADESRLMLAESLILQGKLADAAQSLDEVHEQSKHFPAAQKRAAGIQWAEYLKLKKAPDAEQRQDELAAMRTKIRENLRQSLDRQVGQQAAGETKLPIMLFETQLHLGEVLQEDQQFAEAAALYVPLIADLKANPPEAIDQNVIRAYVGAVKANLAAGQVAEAGAAAVTFAEQTQDTPEHNGFIVDFARLLKGQVKKAEAGAIEAKAGGDAAAIAQANSQWDGAKSVLLQLLDKVAARQNHNVKNLLFIGDSCAELAQSDKARDVYLRLLDTIEKDPQAKETAGGAVTRVRSQLIGLLRSQGKFAEANKQVDELLKSHPNALEPLMEKGRILQSWAESDPKRYSECVAHWTKVRTLLGRIRNRPPEYYEALYNAALCLLYDARFSKSKDKALQAEQILKSTLTLSPTLNGPDMVARYKALLNEALAYQGKPAIKSGGKPAEKSSAKADNSP